MKAVCHPEHGDDYCKECLAAWPCDAIQALDALERAEVTQAQAEMPEGRGDLRAYHAHDAEMVG